MMLGVVALWLILKLVYESRRIAVLRRTMESVGVQLLGCIVAGWSFGHTKLHDEFLLLPEIASSVVDMQGGQVRPVDSVSMLVESARLCYC